jgi:hypothetical protein
MALSQRAKTFLGNLARRGDFLAQGANVGASVEPVYGNAVVVRFTDLAAAGSTGIGASLAGNAASNAMTISAQPGHARTVRAVFAASWDGGNLTIVGTDQDGMPQTELVTAVANSTVEGAKVFKTITSITKSAVGAAAAAVTVGPSTKIGFGVGIRPVSNTVMMLVNGVAEAATVDYTLRSWTPGTTAPNGTNDYNLWCAVLG